jgi:Uma2 family endonuclease
MVLRETLYTAEEFWEFANLPENEGRRFELDDGVIVKMAESKPINTVTAGRILYFFNAWVMPRDLGYVTGADGGYRLAANRVRLPDVAFISKQRSPELPERFQIAPDLAVEVVSPDEDVFKKAREYIAAGTRMVWAVYPDERAVHVFRPADSSELRVQTFGLDDTLDGGDVLPGFTLAVSEIFPE